MKYLRGTIYTGVTGLRARDGGSDVLRWFLAVSYFHSFERVCVIWLGIRPLARRLRYVFGG